MYNFVCANYFEVGRSNILYSACFFLTGGLIYLYRDEIIKLNQWGALGMVGGAVVLYYLIGGNAMMCLLVSTTLLIYAIIKQGGILENRVTKFFSGVSMEIYLSHMVIFRAIEKLKLNLILGNGWVQYVVTSVLVIAGATVFAVIMQKIISTATKMMEKRNLIT